MNDLIIPTKNKDARKLSAALDTVIDFLDEQCAWNRAMINGEQVDLEGLMLHLMDIKEIVEGEG